MGIKYAYNMNGNYQIYLKFTKMESTTVKYSVTLLRVACELNDNKTKYAIFVHLVTIRKFVDRLWLNRHDSQK